MPRGARLLTLLALAPLALGAACDDATSPDGELPDADVRGSFVLVRAAGAPLEQTCFVLTDPAEGMMMSVGLVSFDTERSVVRQREVRLSEFGCLGQNVGDTIVVDQERAVRVEGPLVIVERPAAGGAPAADTGTLVGDTFVLRRGNHDFVYERFSREKNAFYVRTSDVDRWMVGPATHSNQRQDFSGWSLGLAPAPGSVSQNVFVVRPAGRPAPGTYAVGARPTAPLYAIVVRDAPFARTFETVSGTLVVDVSTPDRVEGSLVVDLEDYSGSSTRIEGPFVSICRQFDTCQ